MTLFDSLRKRVFKYENIFTFISCICLLMIVKPVESQTSPCFSPPNCVENPSMTVTFASPLSGDLAPNGSVQCPGWNVAYGTPTRIGDGIWMWSYYGQSSGEGVFTCYNFQSGQKYKVCLDVRTTNAIGSFGYNSDGTFNIQATNGDFSRPTNVSSQVIASWHMVDQAYTSYSFTFISNSNYSRLWLFPYMACAPAVGAGGQYESKIKNVRVEQISDNIPSIEVISDTIRIVNSPITPGYWSWEPSTNISSSNTDSSQIIFSGLCSPTILNATYVSSCGICTIYSLSETVVSKDTSAIFMKADTTLCAGDSASLAVSLAGGIWNSSNQNVVSVSNNGTITGISAGSAWIGYSALNAYGCPSNDSIMISVVPTPVAKVLGINTLCAGDSTLLTGMPAGGIWNSSNQNVVSVSNNGTITGISTGSTWISYSVLNENGCSDIDSIMISIPPTSVVKISGGNTLCTGDSSLLTGIPVSGNWNSSNQNIVSIDNNGTITGISAGSAWIGYSVSNANGCANADSILISVNVAPVAGFHVIPDDPENIFAYDLVSFIDTSINAVGWLWDFGDSMSSTQQNPYHMYAAPGKYYVCLWVVSPGNCVDSVCSEFGVSEGLVVPNVFTPNNDGYNDYFEIRSSNITQYHLQIFNRWGLMIFESSSPTTFWNGKTLSGVDASEGTYYYIIDAKSNSKDYSEHGSVTLLR